jgi:hypothetical protein
MTKKDYTKNDVFVNQFVSRIASTGRAMHTIEIDIKAVFGKVFMNTLWGDIPYKFPTVVLMRIKWLIIDALKAGHDFYFIRDMIDTYYYWGFPKKQNISDYKRYVIHRKRVERCKGIKTHTTINIYGRATSKYFPIKKKIEILYPYLLNE